MLLLEAAARLTCVLNIRMQSKAVTDIAYIKKLQRVVGQVMCAVDTFGGVTRQVRFIHNSQMHSFLKLY